MRAEPRRSIAARNAASVLPDPVGASSSVWSPAAMAGQPWAWAPVGARKLASNHARVGAPKRSSGDSAITGHGIGGLRHSRRPPGAGRMLPDRWLFVAAAAAMLGW